MSTSSHKHEKTHSKTGTEADAAPDAESKPATGPGPDIPAKEEQSVESDFAALTDRILRLQADFDNYRKRMQRDQADLYRRSLETIMADLLPVLDHFELGLKNAAEQKMPETFTKGFALVHDQLKNTLSKYGLSPLDAVGAMFDPMQHESLSALPSNQPRDTVIEQYRRGYRLGDQLLRPSQVILSLGPAEDETDAAPEA